MDLGNNDFMKLQEMKKKLPQKEIKNFEKKDSPKLLIKVKSFKFTKEMFLNNRDLVKKIKDAKGGEVVFKENSYVFILKEKPSDNPKNFLIWIKGKNDTNFTDFKKFVIIGKNHKLLVGEELQQENIRRSINFFVKKINESVYAYENGLHDVCGFASNDPEKKDMLDKLNRFEEQICEHLSGLVNVYENNKEIYKNKETLTKVQNLLNDLYNRGYHV